LIKKYTHCTTQEFHKIIKKVYRKIKQIKYKNWEFDTCDKGMDMDLWN
jgi:hypothetical protein